MNEDARNFFRAVIGLFFAVLANAALCSYYVLPEETSFIFTGKAWIFVSLALTAGASRFLFLAMRKGRERGYLAIIAMLLTGIAGIHNTIVLIGWL